MTLAKKVRPHHPTKNHSEALSFLTQKDKTDMECCKEKFFLSRIPGWSDFRMLLQDFLTLTTLLNFNPPKLNAS